ncbi:MAG: hypothetical protein WC815_06935 [Vicinamibacterales bacterium]|jgi:hypothetical protein
MASAAPTVLWRLCKPPGNSRPSEGGGQAHARAVILPGGPPYTLAFFANAAMDRAENYDTMDLALFRADEIKRSLADDGWVEESDLVIW